jgi:hypothetical protein
MNCTTPGCTNAAVVQWQKLLDDDAAKSHLESVHQVLAQAAEDKRLTIRIRIAALKDAKDNPPKNLSPQDLVAFQARADQQLEAAQKEHDAIPLTFDLEHQRAGSSMALGACEDHKHDDAEWYAARHAATCSGEKGCGC